MSDPTPARAPCPVTLVSGFLGAGKTTLVEHVLRHASGRRLAVIVNELSRLDIDAGLLRAQVGLDGIVELPDGCVCCERRDDLVGRLETLVERHAPAAVLVESTGVADPLALGHAFAAHEEGGGRVVRPELARLDTRVTVVDASSLLERLETAAEVAEGDARARRLSELLVHQIEFADVLVVNKTDQTDAALAARVEALLEQLNPHALRLACAFGAVSPEAVLATGRFSLDATQRAPGWLEAARAEGAGSDGVVVAALGVTSFVYRARRPFHPERLEAVLRGPLPGVVRAKGWLWLSNVSERVLLYSQSGRARELRPLGRWWATRHPIGWPSAGPAREALDRRWQEPWGDRRQEIVWLGVDMDRAGIQKALDACLLSDAEMADGAVLWQSMPQPFAPFPWRHLAARGRART